MKIPILISRYFSFLASCLYRCRIQLLVFGLFSVVEIILGQTLNTTWEWDASTRSIQGYEIATKGLRWYFFDENEHYIWLPFWQLLLGFEYDLFHVDTILLGEISSALCAGATAVYVFLFLKKFGLDESRSILGSLMLFTFGNYVAYSSQAMTESFSVLLLFACLYYLYKYFDTGSLRSLVIASLTSLVHVATRYEAWFFLVVIVGFMFFSLILSKNSRLSFGKVSHILLFTLPSIVFIGLWFEYNLVIAGNITAFKDWIMMNNDHESFFFYNNIGYTIVLVFGNMFFTLGIFWISIVEQLKQLTNRNRRNKDNILTLFGLIFLGHAAYLAYSMFTELNNGWARHLLYLVPISIVSFSFDRFSRKPILFIFLAFNVVIGIFAFAYNMQARNLYI